MKIQNENHSSILGNTILKTTKIKIKCILLSFLKKQHPSIFSNSCKFQLHPHFFGKRTQFFFIFDDETLFLI